MLEDNQANTAQVSHWSPRTKTVVIAIILFLMAGLVFVFTPLLNALLIAGLFAYMLDPLVRLFMRNTRISRPWGARLVFVVLFLLFVSIPALLGTLAAGQLQRIKDILVESIDAYKHWIAQPIEILDFHIYPQLWLDNLEQAAGSVLSILPEGSFNFLSDLTANVLWLFVAIFSLYYFLKDGPKIKPWLVSFSPAAYQYDFQRLFDELDDVWSEIIRVQLLIFAVLAILMIVGTSLVVLLFTTGMLGFSPFVFILLLIVVYTAAQQVDNLWLRPQLLGNKMQMHPGLVFVGLTGGLMVGGVLGALLAMPFMATVKVVGRYIYCQLLSLPCWPEDEQVEVINGNEQESETIPGSPISGSLGP